MCINWTIKCLILLMHGATMKFNLYSVLCDVYTKCIQVIYSTWGHVCPGVDVYEMQWVFAVKAVR